MRIRHLILVLAILVPGYVDVLGQSPSEAKGSPGIPVAAPAQFGVDTLALAKMTRAIEDQVYPNIHSVLIAMEGQLIYEKYFTGRDYNYGRDLGVIRHSDSTLHDVRSISKTVVAACVGIAIKEGYLYGVEEKVASFFPEYNVLLNGEKADWTVRDFLTMTTGLDWNERVPYSDPKNDEIQMYHSEDPVHYVFSKEMAEDSVRSFNYCGGATQVLARIVEKTSGLPIDQFAKEYLFDPLNIERFEWNRYPGSGQIGAPSGLRLTSRDLMKIGLLYRDGGLWNGTQIISQEWVDASFSRQVAFPSPVIAGDDYYGYQVWIWDDSVGGLDFEMVSATGNGDQHIYWDLDHDLIIVTTAGNYNQWDIQNNSGALYRNEIYPALDLE